MRKKTFLMLILSSISFWGSAQGIEFLENSEWKEVVKTAKEQNKFIFVDCYTIWCGPCKLLSKNVFPKKQMGDLYNQHFVNVKYDMEKVNGLAFGKIYKGITSFPTLLFINPKTGEILHKVVGSKPMGELLDEARKCINGDGLLALQNRYDNGERSFEFIKAYVETLHKAKKNAEVQQVIASYLNEQDKLENLLTKEKWDFYSQYMQRLDAPHVQYVIRKISLFDTCSFVNGKGLRLTLESLLRRAAEEAAFIRLDESQMVYSLHFDAELFNLVRKNNRMMRSSEKEAIFSRLVIFEALKDRDWNKSYTRLQSARDFQFIYVDRILPNLLSYMAQEIEEREFLQLLLENVRRIQMERTASLFHNYYGVIAVLGGRLGLKAEADDALTKYKALLPKLTPKQQAKRRMAKE